MDDTSTPYPLVRMFELLSAAKVKGLPFEEAWRDALPKVLRQVPADEEFTTSHERTDWRLALNATRVEWEHCYDGEDTGLRGLGINLLTQ